MKRIAFAVLSLASIVAYGQSAAQQKPKYNLAVDVGLIMQAGNVIKVMVQDFRLLDAAVTAMPELDWPYNKTTNSIDKSSKQIAALAHRLNLLTLDSCDGTSDGTCRQLRTIQKHTAAEFTTDFEGKSKLSVPAGVYVIFGYGTAGKNTAAWHVKVDLTADQTVILSNRNAFMIESGA